MLRRLSVDLRGLLPTPGEMTVFLADRRPDAWERQVDRFLASPRYGEAWARHWLDVVHFAETHGNDQDRPRENAWPYRDYVIQSFNSDKPYARFVDEQVAADGLFPDQPELIPALGFLAAGPWDESTLRDIREDTLDREIGRYLDRDDIVANVMSTFASVTVHCARCHDHKFDPIPQSDYYALQAVFAQTEKAERLYDLDPRVNAARSRWMRLQVALDRKDQEAIAQELTPDLQADVDQWEKSAVADQAQWHALEVDAIAAGPQGFKIQSDGSWLATGPAPEKTAYDVVARLPASSGRITALRLELLTDASLPAQGPGRADNGNLHLTGLEVFASPGSGGTETSVSISGATADFNQEGWEISRAIDKDPSTGWGIHPQEGRPHAAVFEFARETPILPGARLRIVLHQDHGEHHTIGRFRLSWSSQPPPFDTGIVPPEVARILSRPRETRAAAEEFVVTTHYLAHRVERELAQLPEPKRVYAGASLFPPNGNQKPVCRPRDVKVLRRGDILKPIDDAAPGALSCISGLPARFEKFEDEAQRRVALARWLVNRDNPLVWRSIVNRVWHYHFGRGIVDTPNDFGRMGGAPSSPELLDWLAVTFRDDLGGSLKKLHALILTSSTWKQQSADPQAAGPLQPLRRRLDAETFRDSLLQMTGRLDLTMGGPSVKQFVMSEGIHVTPRVDYAAFNVDSPAGERRSIYRFLFRTLPDPLMDTLDCPAGDQSTPVRSESFTALQAFALLNHPFVVRQCEHVAERLEARTGVVPQQVCLAVNWVYQRQPTAEELTEFVPYVERRGLANLCRLLLNSNELHFVE